MWSALKGDIVEFVSIIQQDVAAIVSTEDEDGGKPNCQPAKLVDCETTQLSNCRATFVEVCFFDLS